MSAQKPWLCALLLDKLGRQIAAASRSAQKQVEKASGKRAFRQVFTEADLLIIHIKEEISLLSGLPGTAEDTSSGSKLPGESEPWPCYAEAPAQHLCELDAAAAIEREVDQRLSMARPALTTLVAAGKAGSTPAVS